MKRRGITSVAVAGLLLIATVLSSISGLYVFASEDDAPALTYYVAPDGDDSAAGTIDSPFATITKARDTIRALAAESGLPDGGITVYLREGTYYLTDPLVFADVDNGTAECPITYKSYEGETAKISGGYTLDTSKLVKPSDEVLARMQTEDAKAHLMAYDLGAAGINYAYLATGAGGGNRIDSRLYVDGVRGWPGRYPNDVRGEYGYLGFENFGGSAGKYKIKDTDGRVANWAEESFENARMYGMFEIDWSASHGKVTKYDAGNQMVHYEGTYSNHSGRYFFYNVLEEIDTVGEYFIDTKTGMLYVYLPENYEECDITFATLRQYVVFADVDYYNFEDLVIEAGVDTLMYLQGDYITVSGCTLRDCSEEAVIGKGDHLRFVGNQVYHIGDTAIHWTDAGDKTKLVGGDVVFSDNIIHDFGELYRVYAGAFFVEGIGYEMAHNEVYNTPHTMLTATATDVLFEYNYVHDVCYEAGDAGAIYTGGWESGDHIVRHNVIKDIKNEHNPYLNPTGFYSDNAGGGKKVYSNLFIDIEGPAIHVAGQDNHVYDNILVNTYVYTDARAYYKFPHNSLSGWVDSAVYPTGALWHSLVHKSNNPGYGTEMAAYRTPWTMLLKTTNVYDEEDPFVGYAYGDSTVRGNVIINVGDTVFTTAESAKHINVRDNVVVNSIEDIGFTDFENGDYSFADDSNLYRLLPGIKPCDFANVGVRDLD